MTTRRRPQDADRIREQVRDGYTDVVGRVNKIGGDLADEQSRRIGYSDEELDAAPEGANLGVGCGNPTAMAAIRPGETVLDLGSGAGFDAFLAARQVGESGFVIGVDMTDAMLKQARENAAKTGATNVEFRKGNIESLPVEDESVDVIISNCVINLSPEKERVYAEAYRVLRPGGRLRISDVVLDRPLPQELADSIDAWIGCVGGANLREAYLETIRKAGFRDVKVESESCFGDMIPFDDPKVQDLMAQFDLSLVQAKDYASAVRSIHVFAQK